MPYIKQTKRDEIDPIIDKLMKKLEVKGDFNYAITLILHRYIQKMGLRYDNLNDAVGIVECAKQEFIRAVVGPYEDLKIRENGVISNLDNS